METKVPVIANVFVQGQVIPGVQKCDRSREFVSL